MVKRSISILNMVRVSYIKPLSAIIFILSLSDFVSAQNRYWRAIGGDWSNPGNWSTTSGGVGPASVPGPGNVAIFNTGFGSCTIDVDVNVAGINVTAPYSIIQEAGTTIQVGTSHAIFAAGVFNGSGNSMLGDDITIAGDLTISGTTFTSTTGSLELQGNYTFSGGSFAHNMGTVKTAGDGKTYMGTQTFNNLILGSAAPYSNNITIGGATIFTVNGTLTVDATVGVPFDVYGIDGGAIHAKGDIIFNSNLKSIAIGTATIVINGTGAQTFTGYTTDDYFYGLPNIEISKIAGTVSLVNNIATGANFTVAAGTVNAGTSKVWFLMEGQTITGNIGLNDVVFNEAAGGVGNITIAAATIVTVNGTLTINSGGAADNCEINGGIIEAKGDIVHNSALETTNTAATGKLLINSTGAQTFTGNADFVVAGKKIFYGLPDVEVAKTGGTLSFAGEINFPNDFIVTTGTIDAISNNPIINYGSENTVFNGTYEVSTARFSSGSGFTTLAMADVITVNNSLEFYSDGVSDLYKIDNGTIEAKGDITINGISETYQKGTAILSIIGTANQLFKGAAALYTHFLPEVFIDKTAGTLTMRDSISVSGDWTYDNGIVDATTFPSTVLFKKDIPGDLLLDAESSTGPMAFDNVIFGSTSVTVLQGDLDIDGDLTLYGVLQPSNHTIFLAGDLTDYAINDAILDIATSKFIFDGTESQTLSCPGRTTPQTYYGAVEINKPLGTLILDYPIEIINSVAFISGIMSTDITNILTFHENATASGGSNASFVSGPVKRKGTNDFTYHLGRGSLAFYAPMKLTNIVAGDATTVFTAEYEPNPPNSNVTDGLISWASGYESWDLSVAGTDPGDTDVTLYYENACLSDIQDVSGAPQDLFMGLYDDTQWNKQDPTAIGLSISGAGATACGTGAETGSITATINGSNFNLVTFASVNGTNPLPIELRSFTAQPLDNQVKLLWSTASETNNAYFAIERISEGLTFYEIGSVQGSNNSNEVLHYSFTDPSPISGINYYRLKQVDFDGSFEYSPVISIDLTNNNSFADLYPNPVKLDFGNKLYFKLNTPETRERMQVKMISMSGAVVYSGFVSIVNNQSYIELAPNTPKGTYIVIFSDGKNINREKIIVN